MVRASLVAHKYSIVRVCDLYMNAHEITINYQFSRDLLLLLYFAIYNWNAEHLDVRVPKLMHLYFHGSGVGVRK